MRVLITGSGGFIGKYFLTYLKERGIETVGIVRKQKENKDKTIIECDLSCEFIDYDKEIDVIIHAAAEASPCSEEIENYINNNIKATQEVIRFAKSKHINRVIYISTISIFGEIALPVIDENADRRNVDIYGLTKYLSECLFEKERYIDCISLLLPGVLGKTTQNPWLKSVADKMLRNEDVFYFNPKNQFNNLIYISDLSEFIFNLCHMDFPSFDRILMGSQEMTTVIEILNMMKKNLKSSSQLIEKKQDKGSFYLNIEKAIQYGYHSKSISEIMDVFCREIQNL